mmetsp:Transcript_27709/g.38696  ORF Transcript_27709/g.38696 Transcript_27709/m.38696 type:complete len:201 (-) Transcript_27709:232-834(-)|eukprot:CAMPEP_0185280640 /NCGR_PEP_ID=MMETSP1359-20130426/66252_1 /TAXON_ID=552665 /ORGANISM="Bigelowiella longifila, Strain CCMP242" /LENGTH=200 /DNA_ID=CAMNT_0027875937 /DNA_START=787 /DNA_END=1389 /DNA_ORIENTATION=+
MTGNNVTESMSSTSRRGSSKPVKDVEKSESHENPSQNQSLIQLKALSNVRLSENIPMNPMVGVIVESTSSIPRKQIEMEYMRNTSNNHSENNLTMKWSEEKKRSKKTRSRLEQHKLTRQTRLKNILNRIRSFMVVGAVMLMTVTGGGFYQAWNIYQMGISFSEGSTQESEEYNPAQDTGYWFAVLVTLYFVHYASHAKST